MPSFWNGSGSIVRSDGTRSGSNLWQQAQAAGVDIEPDDHDVHDEGLALSIADCINRNGENSPTAAISWGNQRLTDLAAGSSANDAVRINLMQLGQPMWAGTAGGTANAITLSTTPTYTSRGTGGLRLTFIANATNTGAVTISDNSIAAADLRDMHGTALPGGAIVSGGLYHVIWTGSQFRLLNWRKPPTVEVFTSDDTWTRPTGIRFAVVEVVGGGGAGGGTPATDVGEGSEGGGGGGGEYARKKIDAANLGATETVTVGAGGAGASAANGGNGETSSFGSHVSAAGGSGGTVGAASTSNSVAGGAGGTGGSGGDVTIPGGNGGRGRVIDGNRVLAGQAGGGSVLGMQRDTPLGAGLAGNPYGGGGTGSNAGASTAATVGADGADGVVIVTSYF